MILSAGDKRREKYLKKGSILRRQRNVGGMSKGCIAGGIVLLVFAALLAVPLVLTDMSSGRLLFGTAIMAPGLLLILLGAISQNRKLKNYLDYYQKETGFNIEELMQVEQELMEPDMFMLGNVPEDVNVGASEKNPQIACMVTTHYFFMPLLMGKSYIRRISDMLLAAYSEEIPGINGYKRGLIFLSKKDDDTYINAFLTEDACDELITELKKRNPALITSRRFTYKDRTYDAIRNGGEIARLFENIFNGDDKGGAS